MIFDDGTSFVGFSASRVVDTATGRTERSQANVGRTHEQISRFSPRDAETYLALLDAYERHWKQAFRRHRFGAPPPWGTPDPLEELLDVPDSRIEPVHQFMTLRQLAHDFFESPELQILFMRASDDVDGLLSRRRARPPGARPLPPADAVLRTRGDRRRRQPGDHRRAGGRRPQARRHVCNLARGRPDHRVRAPCHRGRARGRFAGRRRRRGQRPRACADGAAALTRRRRSADRLRRRIREHPLRPGPAALGELRASTSRRVTAPKRTTPAWGPNPACTGVPRISTTCPPLPARDLRWRASRDGPTSCARSTACGIGRGRRRAATSSASRSSPPPGGCSRTGEWREIKRPLHRQPAARVGSATRPNMTPRQHHRLARVRAGRHRARAPRT